MAVAIKSNFLMFVDKDQECDIETRVRPQLGDEGNEGVDGGPGGDEGEGGRVMCTIKGVGNKSLNHTNSLSTITAKVPKYGVHTAQEDELSQYLDNIDVWGIDVFKISEFSNLRPLTAVTFTVFQVSYKQYLV